MSELPTVVSTAEVQIGNITLRVHHLSNNQRVIDADSVGEFVAAMEAGTLLVSEEDSIRLAKALLA